jgi:hypothetical protein
MALSDPYFITLSSPAIAADIIDRMKPVAQGELWAEIRPEDADQFKLLFGSKDGLAYYVYCPTFSQARELGQKWGGLR